MEKIHLSDNDNNNNNKVFLLLSDKGKFRKMREEHFTVINSESVKNM